MWNSRASGGWRKVAFFPAIVIVFVAGLAAEAKSPDRLSEFIKVTGLDSAFDQAAAQLKVSMSQTLQDGPVDGGYRDKVLAGLTPAIDAAFAPATLKRNFRIALDGKLTNADLDKILAFLKSPIGRRIAALEKASNTPDAQAQIESKAAELLERLKKEPERAKLLILVDRSMRLTENATEIGISVGRAAAIGMAAAKQGTGTLSAEVIRAIDSELQKMRPEVMEQLKQQMVLMMAYTYRDASIEELRQYLAFLNSPVGKKLYEVSLTAMSKVLVKAGGEFGHALMKELGKNRV